ncbi:hypothetical protein HGRIS_002432 [Hohenbuehelia grisea]|uniref:Uncharacterized protein n=1 Tax=Hohenbuehelia grisea TaxID=104357 RepID=A0ABR3JKY2_9AGAR
MEHEPGDDYIRRLAAFVHAHEKNLAEGGLARRRRPSQRQVSDTSTILNPLAWFSTSSATPSVKPAVLSLDTHRLFYVLMRFEALGMDVGTLDVEVENPSRPTSYIHIPEALDKSDALSMSSFRSSFSSMSTLSLGGGWWSRPQPSSIEAELKYLFTSFNILPALTIAAPGKKGIAELAKEPSNFNALPLDAFRNLQSLECVDIDPRTLLGWDRLAECLRSLKIRKSALEDVTDIFVGAVVDDQARRAGSSSRKRRRNIPHISAREPSFCSTRLPSAVPEDAHEDAPSTDDDSANPQSSSPPPSLQLSSSKWALLKYLSLSDNALTFFPVESIPYLTPLTHLDLSSNLLVSIPSGLSSLYNLISLNLSDNMIDSVLGIYMNLGQVLHLNLSHNRLDSICGLERLRALERVDLRNNYLEDSAEVGRLATLPNVAEIYIEGNPFVDTEENYRVTCFNYFWKEGRSIVLDGAPPSFYEKRSLSATPDQQMTSSRPVSSAYSPPVVAVGHLHPHANGSSSPSHLPPAIGASPSTSSNTSPYLGPVGVVGVVGRPKRKKNKRIVQLDAEHSDGATSSRSPSHTRHRSDGSAMGRSKMRVMEHTQAGLMEVTGPDVPSTSDLAAPIQSAHEAERAADAAIIQASPSSTRPLPARSNGRTRGRHSRYQTEHTAYSPSFEQEEQFPSPLPSSPSRPSFRRNRGSATFSSKGSARRTRVSASVYEPPGSVSDGEDGKDGTGVEIKTDAEAYRQRIEALKQDMGEGWLKVFSQRV